MKREGAADLGRSAAVEPVEDAFAIVLAKLVQQVVGADSARLCSCVLAEKARHRFCEFKAVHGADGSPVTGTSDCAVLSPSPCDDDEVMLPEDRSTIVARDADASCLDPGVCGW